MKSPNQQIEDHRGFSKGSLQIPLRDAPRLMTDGSKLDYPGSRRNHHISDLETFLTSQIYTSLLPHPQTNLGWTS